MKDFVYVMAMETDVRPFSEYRKIGRTCWVEGRRNQIQTGMPVKVVVRQSFEFADRTASLRFEQACHRHFSTQRLEGEWFELHEAEVEVYFDQYLQEIRDEAIARVQRLREQERIARETRAAARLSITSALSGPAERAHLASALAELGL